MQVSVPVDALDDDGRSALDYARAQQQEEVMRLLDPKAETNQAPQTEQHGQVPIPPPVLGEREFAVPAYQIHTFAPRAEAAYVGPPRVSEAQALGSSLGSQVDVAGLHAPRALSPAFSRTSLGAAFGHFVPTEGPSAFDHFNVYGANAQPEAHYRADSPQSAFGVPTEGPSAADHFNVYSGKAQTPPPPPPPRGMGFRSASDTRLGDRLYGGPNRMGSEERLPERPKSLAPSRRSSGSPMAERRIGKVTAAMRSLSGVEALREKGEKDLGGRRARAAAEAPQNDLDLESTVKPGDGQEGDSLRKRLGKRPTWSSQQVSPGRRADECDDEPSWGSWF